MILGIGTDIINIERMERALTKHGARFVARCFAEEERLAAEGLDFSVQAKKYAKRWAAKEACAKAMGLGIRDNIYLKDIIVLNDLYGKPSLLLKGGAEERLTALTPKGMTPRVNVSLTDEPPMAMAFVVISAVTA